MKKLTILCIFLLLLMPAYAHAAFYWTSEGYTLAAHNAAGQALLLSQEARQENGLITNVDAKVTLLDEKDDELWTVILGGNGEDKLFEAIATEDGWLIVGSSSSSDWAEGWYWGWYDDLEPKTDAVAVRLNAVGEVLWVKCYGGSDWDSFTSVCAANGGGWVIVGETFSSDGDVAGWHDSGELFTHSDGWAVRISEEGEIVWQRPLGGSAHDTLAGVCAVDGGYVAVGATESSDGDVHLLVGERAGWAVRFGDDGEILGGFCYGGSGSEGFVGIAHGAEGLLAVGYSWSPDLLESYGKNDGWAVCLDQTGAMLWQERFGSAGNDRVRYVNWEDGFWAISGYTEYSLGEVSEWIAAMPEGGGEWKVLRGKM